MFSLTQLHDNGLQASLIAAKDICHLPYQVPLSFCFGFLIIPRLISEWFTLPHVFQDSIYQCLADQNAEVHNEEYIHGPETQDSDVTEFSYPEELRAAQLCVETNTP